MMFPFFIYFFFYKGADCSLRFLASVANVQLWDVKAATDNRETNGCGCFAVNLYLRKT